MHEEPLIAVSSTRRRRIVAVRLLPLSPSTLSLNVEYADGSRVAHVVELEARAPVWKEGR